MFHTVLTTPRAKLMSSCHANCSSYEQLCLEEGRSLAWKTLSSMESIIGLHWQLISDPWDPARMIDVIKKTNLDTRTRKQHPEITIIGLFYCPKLIILLMITIANQLILWNFADLVSSVLFSIASMGLRIHWLYPLQRIKILCTNKKEYPESETKLRLIVRL